MSIAAAFRHPISYIGALLAGFSALLFFVGFFVDLFGLHTNPYLGIVFFIALPSAFIVGLLLIPLGLWLEHRRRLHGLPPSLRVWPRVDLNSPRTRAVVFAVLVLTPANLIIVGMAGYKGVEYMDSVSFCGQVCHEVMEPQFVAYQFGPHARVEVRGLPYRSGRRLVRQVEAVRRAPGLRGDPRYAPASHPDAGRTTCGRPARRASSATGRRSSMATRSRCSASTPTTRPTARR
jgi:hypothetical protein